MAAIDWIAYCELKQVLSLYEGLDIPPNYNSLHGWFDKMSTEEELKNVDSELKKILEEYEQLREVVTE